MRSRVLLAATVLAAAMVFQTADLSAQSPDSRFGVWRMQSDAPPPAINIMTYEPWGDGGMRVTVESTNASGVDNKWSYETLFDGEFRPVTGQQNAETAVEFVDERTTRIYNKRGDRVTQIIINTLSVNGNTIENEYVRFDEEGKITGVGHATYVRIR